MAVASEVLEAEVLGVAVEEDSHTHLRMAATLFKVAAIFSKKLLQNSTDDLVRCRNFGFETFFF